MDVTILYNHVNMIIYILLPLPYSISQNQVTCAAHAKEAGIIQGRAYQETGFSGPLYVRLSTGLWPAAHLPQ